MTLGEGLALTGGITPAASKRDIEMIRGSKTMWFDLRDFPIYPPPVDPELQPGDIVRVHARVF
jgi:protein involved in polysaccharide export with SLBB domain